MDNASETLDGDALSLIPGLTLLVVEDCKVSAQSIRLMARACNIRVRHATSIAAARRHLSIFRPSAVVVDIGLPDGSGCRLIREIVAGAANRPAILAISGASEGREAALNAGADAFSPKPFTTPDRLRDIIGSILPASNIAAPHGSYRPDASQEEFLRQDLLRIQAALKDAIPADDRERLEYCGQFLRGLGAELDDDDLELAGLALVDHSTGTADPSQAAVDTASRAIDLCTNRLELRTG